MQGATFTQVEADYNKNAFVIIVMHFVSANLCVEFNLVKALGLGANRRFNIPYEWFSNQSSHADLLVIVFQVLLKSHNYTID